MHKSIKISAVLFITLIFMAAGCGKDSNKKTGIANISPKIITPGSRVNIETIEPLDMENSTIIICSTEIPLSEVEIVSPTEIQFTMPALPPMEENYETGSYIVEDAMPGTDEPDTIEVDATQHPQTLECDVYIEINSDLIEEEWEFSEPIEYVEPLSEQNILN